jgi:type I restriction enzyme S subunit
MDESPLPQGWVWALVGELGRVTTGNTPSKKDPGNYGDYLPFVKPPELLDSVVSGASNGLSEKGTDLARVLPSDSVLVSCIGILGKTGINRVPVAFNQQINAITLADGLEPRYVFYYFQSTAAKGLLNRLASATTVTIVNKSKFKSIPVPLAPLPEQHRIVAEIETQFTRLDAGIAALKRAQANLRRYKASVLKAACEGRLVPTEAELARQEGRDCEPASVLLERILAERRAQWEELEWQKQIEKAQKRAAQARRKAQGLPSRIRDLAPEEWQDIPEAKYSKYLPKDDKWKAKYKEPVGPNMEDSPELREGWALATLNEIVGADGVFSDGDWVESKDQDPGGVVRLIQLADVGDGVYRNRSARFLTHEKALELRCTFLDPGDVLIARMPDPLGRACIFPGDPKRSVTVVDVCIMRTGSSGADHSWLMYTINSPAIRAAIARLQSGSTRKRISRRNLAKIELPIPPLPEQHRIVAEVERRLSVVQELEATVEANLKRAGRLRRAILKRAFEGKLVPQDPNDEPAGVLLERIQRTSKPVSRADGHRRKVGAPEETTHLPLDL